MIEKGRVDVSWAHLSYVAQLCQAESKGKRKLNRLYQTVFVRLPDGMRTGRANGAWRDGGRIVRSAITFEAILDRFSNRSRDARKCVELCVKERAKMTDK